MPTHRELEMLNVNLQELQNFERGDLTPEEIIDLFQRLIDGGLLGCLATRYLETADGLWDANLLQCEMSPSLYIRWRRNPHAV
jgi:hypothetical protein